jgi:hypothetical protein
LATKPRPATPPPANPALLPLSPTEMGVLRDVVAELVALQAMLSDVERRA